MTKPDPLKIFFEAGEAPASDRGFRTAVMERVARRRLQFGLARAALAALVVFAALQVLGPVILALLAGLSASLAGVVLVLGATGLAAFAGHYLATRTVRLPGWMLRLI